MKHSDRMTSEDFPVGIDSISMGPLILFFSFYAAAA
jgi:hypothetical protein